MTKRTTFDFDKYAFEKLTYPVTGIQYACEICGRVYSTIKDASTCEQEHKREECKKEDEEG